MERLLVEPQCTLAAAYTRLYNLIEMTVTMDPFDARVALAGCVALVCHYLAMRRLPPTRCAGAVRPWTSSSGAHADLVGIGGLQRRILSSYSCYA